MLTNETLLHVTAHSKYPKSYGSNIPLVSYSRSHLSVIFDLDGVFEGFRGTIGNLKHGRWHSVEILQQKEHMTHRFTVVVDGRTFYNRINHRPAVFRNVSVSYGGDGSLLLNSNSPFVKNLCIYRKNVFENAAFAHNSHNMKLTFILFVFWGILSPFPK